MKRIGTKALRNYPIHVLLMVICIFLWEGGCFSINAQSSSINFESNEIPITLIEILSPDKVILFGELHGTNETPQFINNLARALALSGKKVTVCLEIPANNQIYIDSFLTSGNKEILNKMPFFNSIPDGRSSKAIAKMIQSMYGKDNVNFLCYDVANFYGNIEDRDSLMANNILGYFKNNNDRALLILTGNIHGKILKRTDDKFLPMGYYLNNKIQDFDFLNFNIIHNSGTIWNCVIDGCNERQLEQVHYSFIKDESVPISFILDPDYFLSKFGYKGVLYIKKVTASFPVNEK